MEANIFELSNDNISISYRSIGNGVPPTPITAQPDIIPNGNQAVFIYTDGGAAQVFHGSQINVSELAIGKLLTVSLSGSLAMPVIGGPPPGTDLQAGTGLLVSNRFVTLLLPSVTVSQIGINVAVETDAILTTVPAKVLDGGSASYQTYLIEPLKGTAQFGLPIPAPPTPLPIHPMTMLSPANTVPATTTIRVFLYDTTTQCQRLAAMAVPNANESRAGRQSLYYNSVLSTIFTVVKYPTRFSGVLDSLLNVIASTGNFNGLEAVFLTLWNAALVANDAARASRAASLWQQYSQTVGANSDIDPTVFYDVTSKMLAFLPEATLRSLRVNGANARTLLSGRPFGQPLVSLASSALTYPFGPPVANPPAPVPVRGGNGGGAPVSSGGGIIRPSPRVQFAETGSSQTAQDAVAFVIAAIAAVGAVIAAPEVLGIGTLLGIFGLGADAGYKGSQLYNDLFPTRSTTVDVPCNGTTLPPMGDMPGVTESGDISGVPDSGGVGGDNSGGDGGLTVPSGTEGNESED